MRDPHLESRFPKLRNGGYRVTSPKDPRYNCVAFAAGDIIKPRYWQWMPARTKGYYWPINWDNSLDSWREVFRLHGYKPCNNGDFEQGVEKIAFYIDEDGLPSHVAKQDVERRKWTSKLGRGKDIEHDTLEVLTGFDLDEYGVIKEYMMRPYRLPALSPDTSTASPQTP